jgi:hypothetical protein
MHVCNMAKHQGYCVCVHQMWQLHSHLPVPTSLSLLGIDAYLFLSQFLLLTPSTKPTSI